MVRIQNRFERSPSLNLAATSDVGICSGECGARGGSGAGIADGRRPTSKCRVDNVGGLAVIEHARDERSQAVDDAREIDFEYSLPFFEGISQVVRSEIPVSLHRMCAAPTCN
jgi:hypothetical protein